MIVDGDRAGVGGSSAPIRFSSVLLPEPDAPGERDQLAGLDRERDVPERRHAAALERLADAVDDDRGAGAHPRGSRGVVITFLASPATDGDAEP